MEKKKPVEEDLTPRPYQSQILELAMERNTIVFLPTGSGKTFIAVMLIKHMAAGVQKAFTEGGKRSFFLVNTVALAEQQKVYIKRHTSLTVGHYTGDTGVDYWKEDKWREELDKHQVLVMTAQILLDILMHRYLTLNDINLIVFDECHHAVNHHCMSKIMKMFESIPLNNTPRVLGLTATLLNSTVKTCRVVETVSSLEETFYSKIATIQNVTEVESFSTCPDETHVAYDLPRSSLIIDDVGKILDDLSDFISYFQFEEDQMVAPIVEGGELQFVKRLSKKLCNKILDVRHHIDNLGMYGGSLSALKFIMHIEILRSRAENPSTMMVLSAIATTFSMIRKMMEDEMRGSTEAEKIYKYSSPQVLTLLEVLKKYNPTDGRGIVFVERRLTAKVLFYILRAISENSSELSYMKPDFVVGFQGNPLSCTRESQLEKKRNKEAVDRFQRGETNIIAASEVLEEGIDIPECKLVIRFDAPKTYRSYVQSKGRARHQNSFFIVLYPKSDKLKIGSSLICYKQIEHLLKEILTGKSSSNSPDRYESEDLYEGKEAERIYETNNGARVTHNSAIPLINRYCSKLPQDMFTKLVPYWFLMKEVKPLYQCLLHLPINSPIKEGFKGDVTESKKLAKQTAAFNACVALHKGGELNNNLLPVGRHSEDFIDTEKIFSVYTSADKNEDMSQPGTKKCRRVYEKQVSSFLCGNTPSANIPLFLHVLDISPSYSEPPADNTRRYSFYKLLKSEKGFGILSSKRLPELCDFPVFLNVGKINVSLKVNSSLIIFNEEEINQLKTFHSLLFLDILKLRKSFLVADLESGINNYLVAPTKMNECLKKAEIDWEVVRNNRQTPEYKQPLEVERLGYRKVDWMQYEHAIVVPWYRDLPPEQVYVVTQVCDDMTPLSCFPTAAFSTFEEYFKRKYELNINNSDQPLFEVKAITNRLNCLKPRSTHNSGRNKRLEQNDDFEEHLVPELCIPVNYPSYLWVKAVCLPSILHRISYLLLAEELRSQIEADIGFSSNHEKKHWMPLEIDPLAAEDQEKSSNLPPPNISLSTPFGLWGDEGEPVDIDRERIEDVTLMDVLYFDEFIQKPIYESEELSSEDPDYWEVPTGIDVPKISILEQNGSGLELSKILQALTCACSNDAFSLERLETLGDSFLKFVSSVFLFLRYPRLDEGKLTQAKGKIVGNRNLFYCGRNRNIMGKIKIHEFNPNSDWIPPMYGIPPEILQCLKSSELCPSILFEMRFPREEQESGILSSKSQNHYQEILKNCDRKYSPSPNESLIGIQSMPDKVIADCVEALIGAYLQGYGLEGALKLVTWFKILPEELATPSFLFEDTNLCSPYVGNDADVSEKVKYHFRGFDVKKLENQLGYVFKDKGYLLQALSHASFSQNRVTDCYQRLEFLGDAILDFLITCYIFEKCGGLSPGDLTDLRSALVNNITFGSLAVRYGLWKFCLYDSSKLFEKVDSYVKIQEKNGHKINGDILLLLDESDYPETIGESVDVPKVLGDLFESLAGAIYLDSGKSLSTVWDVYYKLMKNELETFSQDIPKQPVRMLYELCHPDFKPPHILEEHEKVMVELEITDKMNKHRFYGVGENKADAKRTAAKLALKSLFRSKLN